jgi:glycosyltransferase involved in cell wall biosynthesis
MVSEPLISVVIPARNEEMYLGECLQSLTEQDYPNYEIIVVNNASTDKTVKVAKRYGVRVVTEEKTGLSYARNRGFDEARGDIIARTDADTVPPINWLSKIKRIFADNPQVVAVSGSDEFYDKGTFVRYSSRLIFWILFYLTRFVFGHYQLSGPNFAVRRNAYRRINVHTDDTEIHEDMDLACHISTQGRIFFDPFLIMPISGRKLKSDPGHLLRYFRKTVYTYFLHHPIHKLHGVK